MRGGPSEIPIREKLNDPRQSMSIIPKNQEKGHAMDSKGNEYPISYFYVCVSMENVLHVLKKGIIPSSSSCMWCVSFFNKILYLLRLLPAACLPFKNSGK